MNQTIVIYFSGRAKMDAPFSDSTYYRSYVDFAAFCAARNTDIVVARGKTYLGNMTFSGGWRFEGGQLVAITGPIKADLIYLKNIKAKLPLGPSDLVINRLELTAEASDKWLTYQRFGSLMPTTFAIDNENWRQVAQQIKTDKIVLKPRRGSGGHGIIIVEKVDFDFPSLKLKVPYIAQEFVDSSRGIPGVCEGYHDLRVILFNGEPKLSFVRTPQAGSLLSNVAQGGTAAVLNIDQVPAQIIAMVQQIDEQYTHYGARLYSADFFMDQNRPYLVEINTQPGFPVITVEGEAYTEQFYQYIFKLLDQAIQDHRNQANV